MSVFKEIRILKENGNFEEAWQCGFNALQLDKQNVFLQTALFWIIYAALKQKINLIKQRENTRPLPMEQNWIDSWVTRIVNLNRVLPNDNIDYRLWNLFTQTGATIGEFCKPLCLYILNSGRVLFRPADYNPYPGETGEAPSTVYKLARMVAAYYLNCKVSDPIPVGKVTGFLQYALDNTHDSTNKVWLTRDKAKVFMASGQVTRARQAFLEVLEKKRSVSWAWFDLATTYQDEPLKASSIVAYGLMCPNKPEFLIKGLSSFANILAQQANFSDASRSLLRLHSIYQKNGWALNKEVTELMSRSWYDASLDEVALDTTIRTLAASANKYVMQNPVIYKGIVATIHKSGKGADIYIAPEQIIPVFKKLFQPYEAFHPGTFVELLCDKKPDNDIPISVKEIKPFTSENICNFSGVLKLNEKGFGFVDNIFVPPFLIDSHTDGGEVSGIAVIKLNKVKNINGLTAILIY